MSDPLEKNPVSSTSYSSYENPELGVSIDPNLAPVSEQAPVLDLTQLSQSSTTSGDHFSRSLALPSHLSPHANVRISDGQGGTRTLEVIDLIRESRTNPEARQQVLLLARAAAEDPRVNSVCFDSKEENILPILAQLASGDGVARHEGALALSQFIRLHPEDRQLQQGLLATTEQIQTPEAREVLVSVYRDSSPQNEGLRNWMQSHTQVAQYVAPQSPASNNPASTPVAQAHEGAVPPASLALGSVTGDVVPAAIAATVLPALPPVALSDFVTDQILSLVEQHTSGTPLHGIPTEGILAFAQNSAHLPASQFDDLLYLRIMASALPLNGFTGNLFGQSAVVAGQLAQEIRQTLTNGGVPVGSDRLAASVKTSSAVSTKYHGDSTEISGPQPQVSAPVPGSPDALQANALNGSFSTVYNFFVPSLLTSLSGMQGISYQPSALGPSPLATQALGFAGHSSYHIEGPTSLDEDSHQGFGGHSQGQGSGQQGGDPHEQQSGQPDSYLA